MSILEEVNLARQDIRTDDYAISIGEWFSMYETGDLDIHPEFQRFFRWNEFQKSALIESILLGIPLPPIFVSQRDDGVWDVIDGLQRLSTIFQLFGVLKNEKNVVSVPLVLSRTDYLPSLQGYKWDSSVEDDPLVLPEALKRIIKRSKIHVSIILKESDIKSKYDLFQRLNTGGSQLSPQEVRNCILVMINQDFFQWIKSLSEIESFVETTSLSDRPLSESYDIELVLRYLIFSSANSDELGSVGDLGVYIKNKMIEMAENVNFDRVNWEKKFRQTFDALSIALGDSAFKRYNAHKTRHEGGFLVSQYEAVACGVSWNLEQGTLTEDIPSKVATMWSSSDFTEWAASGVTASRRLRRTVPFARSHFNKL